MRTRSLLATAALLAACGSPLSAIADEDLSIVINPRTGDASIRNDSDSSIDLDGYLLRSAGATFDPIGWNSLDEQGLPGWFDGPAAANRLADTNLLGSSSLAPGATFDLGAPYTPFLPSSIGEVEPGLDFTYSVPDVGSFSGDVEFSLQNTVVLVVDPVTGDAALENQSAFDLDLEAYLIKSTSSVLSTEGWSPLQDSTAGWGAATGASNRLAEGNLLGSTFLAKDGGSLSLGSPINPSALTDETDLELEFRVPGIGTIAGGVLFQSSTVDLLPGDFDGNGAVGDGDLTLLLSNWGNDVPPVPAGWTGAQPTAPGVGDDELTALLGSWGASAGSSAFAVPEPTALTLVAFALLVGAKRRS
ncbi:hypothetical protein MalM25_07800 [Planctomycetes bacterium MalM25]|nr:hypothetical protein MalM25_07800 [Planctomycetes bacterium MalM25]